MIIKNPDPCHIYHIWHYCAKCGKTFTHSQGEFDDGIKKHNCFLADWQNLKNMPSSVMEKEI